MCTDQRNLLSKRHNDALALEAEVTLLRSRNEELSSALIESKKCLEEQSKDHDDLLCTRDEELMKLQNELLSRRRIEAEQKLDFQQRLRAFEEDSARAKRAAEVALSGRDDALKEVEELRKLLSRSQNALSSLNPSARSNSYTERRLRLERATRKIVQQSTGTSPPKSPSNSLPVETRALLDSSLTGNAEATAHNEAGRKLSAEQSPNHSTPPRDPSASKPRDPSLAPRQDPPTGSTPGELPTSKNPLLKATPSAAVIGADKPTLTGIQVNIRPELSFLASPVGSAITDGDFCAPLKIVDAESSCVVSTEREVGEGGASHQQGDVNNDFGNERNANAGETNGNASTQIESSDGGADVVEIGVDVQGSINESTPPTPEEKKDGALSATPESPSQCYTSFDHEDDQQEDMSVNGSASEDRQPGISSNKNNAIDSFSAQTAGETDGTSPYQSDFETSVTVSISANHSSAR